MSVPTIAQILSTHSNSNGGPFTFSSNNTSGNGIVVSVSAQLSSGTVTGITLTDNNGNTYTAIPGLYTNKALGAQAFACTNLSTTPNAKIAITVSATGGTLIGAAIIAIEYNNVSKSNIVSASSTVSGSGPTTLSNQPSGTTAVGISMNPTTPLVAATGPPTWVLQSTQPFVFLGLGIWDSENFPSGTVSFADARPNASGVTLIVLSALVINPTPWVDPNINLHTTIAPTASATNVINYSGPNAQHNSPGDKAATGTVSTSNINVPDNKIGSNSAVIPNQNQGIVASNGTVKGRYDVSTVINNPA